MLLARLQREAQRGVALGVDAHANEATGQLPLEPLAHRDVRGVGTAEEQRHPKALRGANRDVGP